MLKVSVVPRHLGGIMNEDDDVDLYDLAISDAIIDQKIAEIPRPSSSASTNGSKKNEHENYAKHFRKLIIGARKKIGQLETEKQELKANLKNSLESGGIVICPNCTHNFKERHHLMKPRRMKVFRANKCVEVEFDTVEDLNTWLYLNQMETNSDGMPTLMKNCRTEVPKKDTLNTVGSRLHGLVEEKKSERKRKPEELIVEEKKYGKRSTKEEPIRIEIKKNDKKDAATVRIEKLDRKKTNFKVQPEKTPKKASEIPVEEPKNRRATDNGIKDKKKKESPRKAVTDRSKVPDAPQQKNKRTEVTTNNRIAIVLPPPLRKPTMAERISFVGNGVVKADILKDSRKEAETQKPRSSDRKISFDNQSGGIKVVVEKEKDGAKVKPTRPARITAPETPPPPPPQSLNNTQKKEPLVESGWKVPAKAAKVEDLKIPAKPQVTLPGYKLPKKFETAKKLPPPPPVAAVIPKEPAKEAPAITETDAIPQSCSSSKENKNESENLDKVKAYLSRKIEENKQEKFAALPDDWVLPAETETAIQTMEAHKLDMEGKDYFRRISYPMMHSTPKPIDRNARADVNVQMKADPAATTSAKAEENCISDISDMDEEEEYDDDDPLAEFFPEIDKNTVFKQKVEVEVEKKKAEENNDEDDEDDDGEMDPEEMEYWMNGDGGVVEDADEDIDEEEVEEDNDIVVELSDSDDEYEKVEVRRNYPESSNSKTEEVENDGKNASDFDGTREELDWDFEEDEIFFGKPDGAVDEEHGEDLEAKQDVDGLEDGEITSSEDEDKNEEEAVEKEKKEEHSENPAKKIKSPELMKGRVEVAAKKVNRKKSRPPYNPRRSAERARGKKYGDHLVESYTSEAGPSRILPPERNKRRSWNSQENHRQREKREKTRERDGERGARSESRLLRRRN